MQNPLYKLFEHKCVLEVCVHIHPIMIKIHPVFFFLNPYFKIPFLKSGCSESPVRCLIIDCFYGPRYVSHPPFLERSANLWAHWLCASTTASYTLVYIWIFIDYYGECEMAAASTYLEQSNRESTHIYGLLVTPRKRGAESAELTSI